ncbi:sugar phosphate isomerase/epimerase family protein [Brevibacillus massiliensis]|uniref:sugar phosphate isomerase/epimerase family protein n=1 Tax=Brevibacillus massiliensis TaxID=1118054 RepID=UPI0002E4439F|nr:sugar phosphate isomerase/epimerase [Brevibacillus massiliensis]
MKLFINLLPYMPNIDEANELLDQWQGGIEISMDGPNWREPVEWDREYFRFERHAGPVSVHSPIWELNLATPRFEVIRTYSYEVYKQCLEWSARIGAEQMTIHPNLYCTPSFLRYESQQYAKENLMRLGEKAQSLGVDLAVENVGFGSFALFTQEEFVQLFQEIPNIKALVDVGHAHINGWDTPAVIRELGEKLCAVHLHDNDGKGDLHLPVGKGGIDWQPIWEALRSLGHPYRAILEYVEGTATDVVLADAADIANELKGLPAQ